MISTESKYEKYKPKKRFGQNFLVDDNIAVKIVKSLGITEEEAVIEIGPGQGALTKHIINSTSKYIAVEIDKNIANALTLKGYYVVNKDFLEFDFVNDVPAGFKNCKLKVIGNIPYNITSGILFKLLDSSIKIDSCVIMLQREVAGRLAAKMGTKQYGILAVQFQALAEVKVLFNVPPTAFFPKPDVVSSVIRIDFGNNKQKIKDVKIFKEFVRSAFSKRRKTLKNSLSDFFEKHEVKPGVLNLDLTKRAEELSVDEFIRLSNELS